MNRLSAQLRELIRDQRRDSDLMFVHSDLLKASYFVEKSSERHELLNRHVNHIDSMAGGCPLWFPAFNYDFPRTKEFDVEVAPSQVGPLSEFFRENTADWRSFDPMFSVAGTGDDCRLRRVTSEMTAFDESSFLARLYERNAIILFYGADLSAATVLHLAESMSGGPLYRYNKIFVGDCHTHHQSATVEYTYHVRPMGMEIGYDWPKITTDLKRSEIFQTVQLSGIDLAGITLTCTLVDFWLERLKEDPLYFLNSVSIAWVSPKLESLGRRFVLEDFE